MLAVGPALLGSGGAMLQSQTARAYGLGISRKGVQSRVQLVANFCVQAARESTWGLHAFLSTAFPPSAFVHYSEIARYDETPMRVKTSGASSSATVVLPLKDTADSVAPQSALAASSSQTWAPDMGELAHTLSHGAKILQSESSSAVLLEHDGQFALFVSSGFEHLQVLERCNAPCLQEALSRQSAATAFSKQFAAKTRVATTDEASANYACERSITASPERHGWESIHYPCEVHICARIHSSVFSLMQSDVTGLIRHALSLNVSAQMNAFRRALREEIRSRGIRVIRGAPPPDATRHRRRVLRLFCSHGRCIIQRQALLALLPNGDWRKSELQMYVLGADAVDKDAALSVFTNGLITALAGTVFEVYPRHRWTGADLAIDRCGLLESVHGLGSATYARYMRLLAVVAHEPATGASAENEVLPLSYASAAYDGGAEDRGYGDEGATAAEGGGAGNSTQRMGDAAAFNAQSRRVASAWVGHEAVGVAGRHEADY
jgi:hypothetical protein